jgi:hypothetical protein
MAVELGQRLAASSKVVERGAKKHSQLWWPEGWRISYERMLHTKRPYVDAGPHTFNIAINHNGMLRIRHRIFS